ncbi:hypothetical protein QYM36_009575, partial [Artemia franciscana]
AADDHLSDLTSLQGEKTSFILTPNTYLSLGTLNVRTLAKPRKREQVLSEMSRYRWDIVGLSKTHLPSSGIERINDVTLITSGKSDGVDCQGVGFLLFKKDVLFLTGDFNAIAGHSNDGPGDVMGKFGHGCQNHRGEILIDFCWDNELFITNTMFCHREQRKVTRRSPDGRTANMIYLILVGKRWKSSVLSTVSIASGDFDSDHVLVMSELLLRIWKPQQPKKSLPRYHVDLLKNIEARNSSMSMPLRSTPPMNWFCSAMHRGRKNSTCLLNLLFQCLQLSEGLALTNDKAMQALLLLNYFVATIPLLVSTL